MSNFVNITGRLADDLEVKWTGSGKCVSNFAVADTPRRKNPQTGEWEDAGDTLWLRGSIWGDRAEDLVSEVHKGDLVTVTGRLASRSYESNGVKHTVIELKAESMALVQRKGQRAATVHPSGSGAQQGGFAPQQPAQDPWSTGGGQGGWGNDAEPAF
jgi:single-strand DNA-binding protein